MFQRLIAEGGSCRSYDEDSNRDGDDVGGEVHDIATAATVIVARLGMIGYIGCR